MSELVDFESEDDDLEQYNDDIVHHEDNIHDMIDYEDCIDDIDFRVCNYIKYMLLNTLCD